MSGDPGSKRRRRNGQPVLNDDERALWTAVTRSVAPVKGMKGRVPDAGSERVDAAPPDKHARRDDLPLHDREKASPAANRSLARPADGAAATNGRKTTAKTTVRTITAPASLPDFDRRHSRRIARGRVEIEARLDLHGLTQRAAHQRLVGFLMRASSSGFRTVLVITGKGGGWRAGAGATGGFEDEAPGVLKRNVPRWLAEPGIAGLVVSFGPAARNHGGDGAFYIQLRQRRT
ncbi:MAG: Smr/MutS family protein [Hyphomicrobiaceae bacterium]